MSEYKIYLQSGRVVTALGASGQDAYREYAMDALTHSGHPEHAQVIEWVREV